MISLLKMVIFKGVPLPELKFHHCHLSSSSTLPAIPYPPNKKVLELPVDELSKPVVISEATFVHTISTSLHIIVYMSQSGMGIQKNQNMSTLTEVLKYEASRANTWAQRRLRL